MSVNMKINVLVVDDDKEIVGAIAALLEREGYNIYKAYDGLMALDMVMSNDIHLMLIDVMMPNMDGLSAIMRIRETKNIPIIVLSAKTEDTDKVVGLSVGADDYMSKPYNPMELVARVKSSLRRYMHFGAFSGNNTDFNGSNIENENVCFSVHLEAEKRDSFVRYRKTPSETDRHCRQDGRRIFPCNEQNHPQGDLCQNQHPRKEQSRGVAIYHSPRGVSAICLGSFGGSGLGVSDEISNP